MKTTDEATVVRQQTPSRLTVRLLFSGDAGVLDGEPLTLVEGATPIGRMVEDEGGISLPDDGRVSRLHAILHVNPAHHALRIVDGNSKNGTHVNGRRVPEATARDGDILRVGDTFLIVREEAEEGDAPMPSLASRRDASPNGRREGSLIGVSAAMRALRGTIALFAPTQTTVMLLGESGTGKELAARAVHEQSGRGGAFVPVNCSTIPETLAESQLFGHTTGAFTGARAFAGFFRGADGGTLFLDEVGEISPAIQPKLLRALEERAVLPVGAAQPIACDVRVVVATNRDLGRAVRAGAFRGDLYARLAEVAVPLPPLRERREDILLILRHYLSDVATPLSPELVNALLLYRWPFNVRELTKVANELRIRGAGAPVLELELVAARLPPPAEEAPEGAARALSRGPTRAVQRSVEVSLVEPALGTRRRAPPKVACREDLEALLRESRGSISDVARLTGRSRRQVYRWLEQFELDIETFRIFEET